jgi:hypothetical protein
MKHYPDWNTTTAEESKQWFVDKFCSPNNAPISPRDRVVKTLKNEAPDRVPFDFWGVPETWDSIILALSLKFWMMAAFIIFGVQLEK